MIRCRCLYLCNIVKFLSVRGVCFSDLRLLLVADRECGTKHALALGRNNMCLERKSFIMYNETDNAEQT